MVGDEFEEVIISLLHKGDSNAKEQATQLPSQPSHQEVRRAATAPISARTAEALHRWLLAP